MKELDCIFIVYGKTVNNDFSNIKSLKTKVIPNIGDTIVAFGERLKVIDRYIDYTQVEKYDLDDPGRGGEGCYIFVEKKLKF